MSVPNTQPTHKCRTTSKGGCALCDQNAKDNADDDDDDGDDHADDDMKMTMMVIVLSSNPKMRYVYGLNDTLSRHMAGDVQSDSEG